MRHLDVFQYIPHPQWRVVTKYKNNDSKNCARTHCLLSRSKNREPQWYVENKINAVIAAANYSRSSAELFIQITSREYTSHIYVLFYISHEQNSIIDPPILVPSCLILMNLEVHGSNLSILYCLYIHLYLWMKPDLIIKLHFYPKRFIIQ